jgi:hypothetical protein
MGLLPTKEFFVSGNETNAKLAAEAMQRGFVELGYPHMCKVTSGIGCASQDVLHVPNDPEGIENLLGRQFVKWTGRRAPLSALQEILNRKRL